MRSIPLPGPGEEPSDISRPGIHLGSPPRAPSEIRTLLKALGLAPQKGFGQNFLVDDAILEKIADAGNIQPNDIVLEIGPGLGHLTHHLVRREGKVIAVEIDRGLIRRLRQVFQGVDNVEFIEQDALELNPDEVVGDRPYKLIANLPYYITSPLLRHFLEKVRPPTTLVVMVQREVGERIVAPAGDLNLLAISVQIYGRPRIVTLVPPGAFYPRPKVESAVVRIDAFDRPRITVPSEAFFKVVSAGFATARKQLHNSLPQRIWMPPGSATGFLEAAGIDPTRRPHTLSVEEWDRLTRVFLDAGVVS